MRYVCASSDGEEGYVMIADVLMAYAYCTESRGYVSTKDLSVYGAGDVGIATDYDEGVGTVSLCCSNEHLACVCAF